MEDNGYLYGIIGVSRVVNPQTQLIDALMESYARIASYGYLIASEIEFDLKAAFS